MSLLRLNRHPSRTQLVVFGVAWLLFLGGWGFVAATKDSPQLARTLWILAGGIPALGLVVPGFLRLVFVGLSYATYPIGFVLSHVVLAMVYYLVFTPVGLLMRLCRYDPLARRLDPKAKTYWLPRDNPRSVASYFRQH